MVYLLFFLPVIHFFSHRQSRNPITKAKSFIQTGSFSHHGDGYFTERSFVIDRSSLPLL